ncbi:MAG TPA: excinuclease ABC subunit UvrA, partial [bacterium]|nr:excinuclease ABC subunit UvrA [bacterium]
DNVVLILGFPLKIPKTLPVDEAVGYVLQQGFTRVWYQGSIRPIKKGEWYPTQGVEFLVVVDRVALNDQSRQRVVDSIETCMKFGGGLVHIIRPDGTLDKHSEHLHCPFCDIEYSAPHANLFSFNSPLGACEACKGFGRIITVDPAKVIPDPQKSLAEGAVKPWTTDSYSECQQDLLRFCRKQRIPINLPYRGLSESQRQMIYCGKGDFYGVKGFFEWLESKSYKMHIRVLLSKYRAYIPCPVCHGTRLRDEASWYRLGDRTITEISSLPILQARQFFAALAVEQSRDKATEILVEEIANRLQYLVDIGLDYLTLDRQSRTLSGGEAQRVNLTRALGGSLVETLYVLDEPSIGLHPRDTDRLITLLYHLRDRGNTVIVVEHDPSLIRAADFVVDLGPGAGSAGGGIVCAGSVGEVIDCPESVTGKHLRLSETERSPQIRPRVIGQENSIRILGARAHNLKGIDVTIPLGGLVCVTGVSGSGKSSLIQDVLWEALKTERFSELETGPTFDRIETRGDFHGCAYLDQSPAAATPRMNAATAVKAFDGIRKCFAETEISRSRGYSAGTFSFNTPGGRCDVCEGAGHEVVEMQFLSDVSLTCPECGGTRYKPEIRDVLWRGRSIVDVLSMTVSDARSLFHDVPSVDRPLSVLETVGLGYITLGQPSNTLSQGENQRLSLARDIFLYGRQQPMLFILDEPTTGLHLADIQVLLTAFEQMLEQGHSLLVVEHNLEVIRNAHWIIDLGPEGGGLGGNIVVAGTPEQVMACSKSHTGRFLRSYVRGKGLLEKPYNAPSSSRDRPSAREYLEIFGAHEHNLHNVSVRIPRNKFVVVTGVSGSGKSSLVFDIVF